MKAFLWKTLIHNGVLFPKSYEPLPKGVYVIYDNKPLNLTEVQEEAACLYARTMHTLDSTSHKNFFKDWKRLLGKNTHVRDFTKLDFRKVAKFLSENPPTLIDSKITTDKYRTCEVDGVSQSVANFMVEPPSLFKGRGDHPLRGMIKSRVLPSDVTLNMSKGASVPKPNVPGQWKEIVHDSSAMWIASWRQNVKTSQVKCIMFI